MENPISVKVEKKILNQFTILSGELDRLRKDLIEEALIEYLKKYNKIV